VATASAIVFGGAAYAASGGSVPWSGRNQPAAANTPAVSLETPSLQPTPVTPVALPTALPAGFKWYQSKSGFRVAWPSTWVKIQESRTSVTLCAPGGPPVVAVREWQPSDPDLGVALRREETAAGLGKYKRLRMAVSPQLDSADWEYTFTDPKMGVLHGLERAVLRDGRAYLIQWRTPAAKWAANAAKRDVVLDGFRTPDSPVAGSRTATPAGFVSYRSKSGFSIAAPARWTKIQETPTRVVFCAPGGPPLVGVRAWAPSDVDLSVALTREERLAKLPRYHRVSMETVPGQQGAVWEYTFVDPKMGPLHGLERAFVTPTASYLIQWRTPADEWKANLPKLGVVTASFRIVTR
jgi:hypothetical protein